MIPVFKPLINKEEVLPELEKIFDSGWIGLGSKVEEFEKLFATYIGTKYAVGVNSCTAALHLANIVLKIQRGDEVIVPSMTFISTALSVLYCQATPIFVDIEEDTLCMDSDDVERKITFKTKAIIPVHFGGHSCNMDKLKEIAKRYNLNLIEDVAHGCGGSYNEMKLGSIGDIGCFSFHAVKNLPTGDGGMITTNDKEIYEKLKKLRWLGIDRDTWNRNNKKYSWMYSIDELGYKCHMNDITAVIGIAQLKVLEKHNQIRRHISEKYNEAFKEIPWIETPIIRPYVTSAYHNYVIKTPYRNELSEYLSTKGISTSVHYRPIHHFELFKNTKTNLPVTEKMYKQLLTLPLYPSMTDEEIDKVIEAVKEYDKK